MGQSDAGYLSRADAEESQLSWQAAPWDQAWPSLQQQNQDAQSSSRSPSSPSFFPMFSTQGMNSNGMSSSMGQSAWNPPEYAPSNGNGMNDSNGFGGSFGSNGSNGGGGRFGRGGLGMHSGSSYSSLGGFLQPEYLPQQEPELPLDTSFESIIGDADLSPDDDLEKKQRLDFALPPTPADYQRHYR